MIKLKRANSISFRIVAVKKLSFLGLVLALTLKRRTFFALPIMIVCIQPKKSRQNGLA